MFPCGRGAFLLKWAGFQKIREDIQIKHENHNKIDPKTIDQFIKLNLKSDAGFF